jgi:hypothetical protein
VREFNDASEDFTMYINITNRKIHSLQKNTVFGWNCFEYIDASLSLRSLDECNKLELDYLGNSKDLKSLYQYCVSLGFVNFLTMLIKMKDKAITNLASERV